uniref:Chromosome transmission fidelity protein 1 n=1 Tax=Tetraselmis sp. GSL018 TaxID=582737 RepID=A0A061RRA7_9CHLO
MSALPLASRKALCINPEVRRLGSAARINERCLDMLRAKPSAKTARRLDGTRQRAKTLSRCPFLKHDAKAAEAFRAKVLEAPLDVEDLGRLGAQHGVCPYYATRQAQPSADILFMPYAALLSAESRESFGICLKDAVIIVDEAHNLLEAVNSAHAADLARRDL